MMIYTQHWRIKAWADVTAVGEARGTGDNSPPRKNPTLTEHQKAN